MPTFFTLKCSIAAVLIPLLGGCSNWGSYHDVSEPDAAKLRFITDIADTSLSYYDAEHCAGESLGTLNNIYLSNTSRRVDMRVAAPSAAKRYLEVNVMPGQAVYLKADCGNAVQFTPQPRAEYEATLKQRGLRCTLSVQHLDRVDGRDVRTALPTTTNGLDACLGQSPAFPKPVVLLPDTPERVALIDQIINATLRDNPYLLPDPRYPSQAPMTGAQLDKRVAQYKSRLGFAMPAEYWALYRRNLVTFDRENLNVWVEALPIFKHEHRLYLQSLDTALLEQWARQSFNDPPVYRHYDTMLRQHDKILLALRQDVMDRHLERLAQMDAEFGVCERFAGCWKPLSEAVD